MVVRSSPVAVIKSSDIALVSSKDFLDIQATIEFRFTLKRLLYKTDSLFQKSYEKFG